MTEAMRYRASTMGIWFMRDIMDIPRSRQSKDSRQSCPERVKMTKSKFDVEREEMGKGMVEGFKRLPTFEDSKGIKYTYDERLSEYRRVYRDKKGKLKIEFIPFESVKGGYLTRQRLQGKLKQVL